MIHQVEAQVLVLLLIAALVGMGARRLRLPYTLALVVAGLGLGFVHLEALEGLALTQDLLLLLFLPPLLFEAAFHMSLTELRRNRWPIFFLAIPGVAIAVLLTAAFAYAGVGLTGLREFGWPHAFLLAAVIAATDPISVLALFKELGAPRRLYVLIEGESLINDGVAVVVFVIIGAVLGISSGHGSHPDLHGVSQIASFATVTFVRMAVGGVLVGVICGGLMSVLTRTVDDHLIETTLTTILAWGSFLLAESIHVSGVLSTVAAGIVMGSFGRKWGMSPTTRLAVEDFWQYAGFVSNSFIFLLIGLELDPGQLIADFVVIVIGFVAVVAARAIVVYGSLPIINRFTDAVPLAWQHIMVWGGLRGSLSMVLIIGLPADFPGRGLLVNVVFGIVAISLFGQGLSMAPLMRKLGLSGTGVGGVDYEKARGAALAAGHVLKVAETMHEEGSLDDATHGRLATWYKQRNTVYGERARELAGDLVTPERMLEGLKALAVVEQESIRHAESAEVISPSAAAELLAEINERIHILDGAAHDSEAELVKVIEALLGTDDTGETDAPV